jgi:DNA topoisomerase-1
MKFPGYMKVYTEKSEGEKEDKGILAPVELNQTLLLRKLEPRQHFTQAPPRYNEASLVKTLEELGIGRPSTYASIIGTILARGYAVREEKQFFPTELGQVVVGLLKEYFDSIVDVEFTAEMEKRLDLVEEGDLSWEKVLEDFYSPFAETLALAEKNIAALNIKPEESGEFCEKCGKPMLYRMGRYGSFLACAGFPECRNTKPIVKATDVICLACGGNIVERKSRSGKIFYGCGNYPQCKYVSWLSPINKACPHCGVQLASRQDKSGQTKEICPNRACPGAGGGAKTSAAKSVKKTKRTKSTASTVSKKTSPAVK